jgi:di/tricarboxylate transporter
VVADSIFLIAMVLSTVGPGAISSVALVIPLAMAISERAELSRFLTALMVANGANAGNLSPISALGVIANTKMAEAGLTGHAGKVWFANFIAHALVAGSGLCAFGWLEKLWCGEPARRSGADHADAHAKIDAGYHFELDRRRVGFKLNVGLSAFGAATLLLGLQAADEAQSFKRVPWGVIVMVSGVSLLIALLEKTGGMEYFTTLLARVASPASINGVIAFITGLISTYSSTSGVVLPAFLPTASKLAAQLGGGDPLAIALSINVGSSIVDVSPLSTLGALCIATVSNPDEARILFRQLLFWGLSMTLVGRALLSTFAGMIARGGAWRWLIPTLQPPPHDGAKCPCLRSCRCV